MLYLLRPYPLRWQGEDQKRLETFVDRLAKVEPYFEDPPQDEGVASEG